MINYNVVIHAVSFVVIGFILLSQDPVSAEDGSTDDKAQLAQDLLNPVADLYNIPIQINYDQNIGPLEDGNRILANIHPVIPFNLNEKWN